MLEQSESCFSMENLQLTFFSLCFVDQPFTIMIKHAFYNTNGTYTLWSLGLNDGIVMQGQAQNRTTKIKLFHYSIILLF